MTYESQGQGWILFKHLLQHRRDHSKVSIVGWGPGGINQAWRRVGSLCSRSILTELGEFIAVRVPKGERLFFFPTLIERGLKLKGGAQDPIAELNHGLVAFDIPLAEVDRAPAFLDLQNSCIKNKVVALENRCQATGFGVDTELDHRRGRFDPLEDDCVKALANILEASSSSVLKLKDRALSVLSVDQLCKVFTTIASAGSGATANDEPAWPKIGLLKLGPVKRLRSLPAKEASAVLSNPMDRSGGERPGREQFVFAFLKARSLGHGFIVGC
jgi:hypothetical protein